MSSFLSGARRMGCPPSFPCFPLFVHALHVINFLSRNGAMSAWCLLSWWLSAGEPLLEFRIPDTDEKQETKKMLHVHSCRCLIQHSLIIRFILHVSLHFGGQASLSVLAPHPIRVFDLVQGTPVPSPTVMVPMGARSTAPPILCPSCGYFAADLDFARPQWIQKQF